MEVGLRRRLTHGKKVGKSVNAQKRTEGVEAVKTV